MHRLLNLFWFEIDLVDEIQILENLENIFLSFDNSVAGDDKLRKYSGASGYIILAINKPSRNGL